MVSPTWSAIRQSTVETDAPDNTIIDAIIEGELTADVMKAKKRLAEIDEMYYNIIV